MKLICLPYAGGNKYSYRNLEAYVEDTITLVTLELPGRGKRMREPLIEDLNALADDLYQQIAPHIETNYMLYGHSMGAMLGNLLIHKLKHNKQLLPQYFLATGCASPKTRHLRKQIHNLNDTSFQQALKKLGGMPDAVIKNQELLDYVTPILRSDIKAIETHTYTNKSKYNVPLMVLYGSEEGLEEKDIEGWQDETSAKFKYHSLEGGHFFINDHLQFVGDIINYELAHGEKFVATLNH